MTTDSFPEEVSNGLQWYVYRLIDPRNGETFYVGKGRGYRVFAHARGEVEEELAHDEEEEGKIVDTKLRRIRAIKADGMEVGHIIHRHGLNTQKLAYEVEAAVIDAYPGLTNKVRGHGSDARGSRHVTQIVAEYAAEEFVVKHRLLMISIGVFYYRRESPYDAVRYAWRVNLNQINSYPLCWHVSEDGLSELSILRSGFPPPARTSQTWRPRTAICPTGQTFVDSTGRKLIRKSGTTMWGSEFQSVSWAAAMPSAT